jgi:hypothetical protein
MSCFGGEIKVKKRLDDRISYRLGAKRSYSFAEKLVLEKSQEG